MKKVVRNSFSNIVHRRLSEILLFETKDPRFKKVTISKVNVAPSMTSAKVLVSIFPAIKASKLDPVKGLKYE